MDTVSSRLSHCAVALAAAVLLAGSVAAQPAPEESTELQGLEEAVRAAQVRQLLERRGLTEEDVRITDLEGRDNTREMLSPSPDAGGDSPLSAESGEVGEQFIVRRPGTVTMRLASDRIDLPGGVAVPRFEESESAGAEGWFQPTLAASPVPAVWDDRVRQYRMRLSLGLEGRNLPPDAALQQPMTVRFGFRGLRADPVEPIRLEQAGLEHEKEMEFLFLPTQEQPILEVRSPITDIDFEIDVMPRVELRPARDSIMGLGLDEVEVQVLSLEPHSTPAPVQSDMPATVEVTTGSAVPDPSSFILPAGETQSHFKLRSQGLGDTTLRVTVGARSDSRTIRQRFPTGPLLATLIGGALGGFSRRFTRNRSGGSTGARIAEGLAVAVIAFVAGILGVGYLSLPAAVVATEAGAFLTGALTGFVGVTVIEGLSKRLSTRPA